MSPQTRYNERSWRIDLISEINTYVSRFNRPIKRAGGESTIVTGSEPLFPDVLLFGEHSSGNILQGWELKMPDTPITDNELIENAKRKAINLGLNSFLLWNVTEAVLYVADSNGNYKPGKSWNDLSKIIERSQVENSRNEWVALLHKILMELNDFFESGLLESRNIIESFSDHGLIDIILRNNEGVAEYLKKKATKDSEFDASVNMWWLASKIEYPHDDNPFDVLSKIILLRWINKLIFAHILKAYYSNASQVLKINPKTSIKDADNIFQEIARTSDFWNIFGQQIGEKYLTNRAWADLIQLNEFLKDVNLERMDQVLLHKVLQATVYANKRKIAGQYATPVTLAQLLVRITMSDKRKDIYDPCCGTGTIARAGYDLKREYGISHEEALKTVWASDKFSFPLQMATIALTDPFNIGQIIHIFTKDATEISTGEKINFINPNNGEIIKKELPKMECIVSNLPFVQQEDLEILNPHIKQINNQIRRLAGTDLTLEGRSDLYAYLPFYQWYLLSNNGKLGIIISNSWLGTDWGETFRKLVQAFFNIQYIVISGKGRWFQSTDVVTTLLVMQKKEENKVAFPPGNTNKISFITLNNSLSEIDDIRQISDSILTNSSSTDISITRYSNREISQLEEIGLEWSAMFADLKWLFNIRDKLIPAKKIFDINRGERRGWDKMFYPAQGHNIEDRYIRPVLKSSRNIQKLIANPDAEAFCCSCSIANLKKLKHKGALSWIKKFEHSFNEKGKPLPKALLRVDHYWYEMKDITIADLIALINYDKRLFIAKMRERAFVNQRLIRFTIIDDGVDIDLCHALLNSILGIFYIEALGFGRGLGALDLSSTKLKDRLFMLNPYLLKEKNISLIKKSFQPLLKRSILPIEEELTRKDRKEFDDCVLNIYGISDLKNDVINSLMKLYQIRMAVFNN